VPPPPGHPRHEVLVLVATHTSDGATQGLQWLEEQPFPFVVYTKHGPAGAPFNYIPPTAWQCVALQCALLVPPPCCAGCPRR
jgi:hypothetical protein